MMRKYIESHSTVAQIQLLLKCHEKCVELALTPWQEPEQLALSYHDEQLLLTY
jgi:hypothetical protein